MIKSIKGAFLALLFIPSMMPVAVFADGEPVAATAGDPAQTHWATSVASGTWNVAKYAGRGTRALAKGMWYTTKTGAQGAHVVLRKAANNLGTSAVVVGAVTAALLGRYGYNYNRLSIIDDELSGAHPFDREDGVQRRRVCNWPYTLDQALGNLAQYKRGQAQAQRINATMSMIVNELQQYINSLAAQQRPGLNAKQTLQQVIDEEIEQLEHYKQCLERLTTHFKNSTKKIRYLVGSFGIHKTYTTAYKNIFGRNATVKRPRELTEQELDRIEAELERLKAFNTRWYHWALFKINYGKAARVWWKVYKKLGRLHQIKDVVDRHMNDDLTLDRDSLTTNGRTGGQV